MSFFESLGLRKPQVADPQVIYPAQQAARVDLPRPFVNMHALDVAGLRRGMWVMSGAGLAIITGARLDGLAEVGLQKPDGTTMMEIVDDKAAPAVRLVDMDSLRAAHIEEIPTSRYENASQLRALGYISASEA